MWWRTDARRSRAPVATIERRQHHVSLLRQRQHGGVRRAAELTIEAPQGHDLEVNAPTGSIPGGEPVTFTVEVSREMAAGERYLGELLLGPPSAPAAVRVPIVVNRR